MYDVMPYKEAFRPCPCYLCMGQSRSRNTVKRHSVLALWTNLSLVPEPTFLIEDDAPPLGVGVPPGMLRITEDTHALLTAYDAYFALYVPYMCLIFA